MPKRGAVALITTICALVLLFTFKTPSTASGLGTALISTAGTSVSSAAPAATSGAAATAGTTTTSGTGTTATAGTTATTSPAATTTTGSTADRVITGTAISFRYGTVQVQVTVSGGAITDVTTLQAPGDGRSGQISQYAVPILQSEALSAKSAQIDLVSGATYTSDAYAQSLQSALDQAGL